MVEPAVEPSRCVAEERDFLLQVGVDAAEEDAVEADVGFVGADRRVDRHKNDLFAKLQQSGGERVVVQTTAAVHACGTGGEIGDFYDCGLRVAECGMEFYLSKNFSRVVALGGRVIMETASIATSDARKIAATGMIS